jgi:hypothetical protein
MGENHQATISNDPAANAPDAAAADKGKGKAVEEPTQEMSMDEEEDSDESEAEEMVSSHSNVMYYSDA